MIQTSPDIDQLSAALVDLQGDLEPVERNAENPFFKARYADLSAVVAASRDLLHKHGLAVVQLPFFDGEHDLLTTRVLHRSGQWLEASTRLFLGKQDAQSHGSAVTYARRYSYGGALGIVTETDDDGHAASQPAQSPRQRTRTRPPAGSPSRESSPSASSSEGNPAADAAPPAGGQSRGEESGRGSSPRGQMDWRQRLAMNVAGLAAKLGVGSDDLRHAIVYSATEGRTSSSKELEDADQEGVRSTFKAVTAGDLVLCGGKGASPYLEAKL